MHRCQAKTGEPFHMRECGMPIVFVAATPPEVPYTGWRHEDPAITDHGAVQGVYAAGPAVEQIKSSNVTRIIRDLEGS